MMKPAVDEMFPEGAGPYVDLDEVRGLEGDGKAGFGGGAVPLLLGGGQRVVAPAEENAGEAGGKSEEAPLEAGLHLPEANKINENKISPKIVRTKRKERASPSLTG